MLAAAANLWRDSDFVMINERAGISNSLYLASSESFHRQ